jgi:hypothetical protein
MWQFLCGGVPVVRVRVQQREIPSTMLGSDPVGDKAYRQRISEWVGGQWADKDAVLDELLAIANPRANARSDR